MDITHFKRRRQDKGLMSWCDERREASMNVFRQKHEALWKDYRSLWATEFTKKLKSGGGERSKLINPTTQVAVDTASADLDAAIGFLGFFDMEPVFPSVEPEALPLYRDVWADVVEKVKDDLESSGSRAEITEAIFNSALYGIGYLKAVTQDVGELKLVPNPEGGSRPQKVFTKVGKLVSVDPSKLFHDVGATSLEDAEYVVEECMVPDSVIREKITSGVYREPERKLEPLSPEDGGLRKVYEYHGLVPKNLIEAFDSSDQDVPVELLDSVSPFKDEGLVNALVIWVEGNSSILYVKEDPFFDGMKPYAAFAWDMNPGHLVGKGVAHKAYNVQKAQDASLRARTDALAYAVHPMVGVDGLKLVNRSGMVVGPGREIVTQGDPNKAIVPFRFGDIPQSVFIQASELGQMADNATGLSAFGGTDPKFQSAQGLDILSASTVNRNRRTLEGAKVFLKRSLEMFVWQGFQFNPEGYPPVIESFDVKVHVGSLTRRSERAQVGNMLKTLPDSSPAYWRLLVSFFELSDLPDREKLVEEVKQLAHSVLNPEEVGPTFEQRIVERQVAFAEYQAVESLKLQRGRVRAELVRASAALEKIDSEEAKNATQAILNLAKAEAEEAGVQLNSYNAFLKQIQEDTRGTDEQFTRRVIGGGGSQEADVPPGLDDTGDPAE